MDARSWPGVTEEPADGVTEGRGVAGRDDGEKDGFAAGREPYTVTGRRSPKEPRRQDSPTEPKSSSSSSLLPASISSRVRGWSRYWGAISRRKRLGEFDSCLPLRMRVWAKDTVTTRFARVMAT